MENYTQKYTCGENGVVCNVEGIPVYIPDKATGWWKPPDIYIKSETESSAIEYDENAPGWFKDLNDGKPRPCMMGPKDLSQCDAYRYKKDGNIISLTPSEDNVFCEDPKEQMNKCGIRNTDLQRMYWCAEKNQIYPGATDSIAINYTDARQFLNSLGEDEITDYTYVSPDISCNSMDILDNAGSIYNFANYGAEYYTYCNKRCYNEYCGAFKKMLDYKRAIEVMYLYPQYFTKAKYNKIREILLSNAFKVEPYTQYNINLWETLISTITADIFIIEVIPKLIQVGYLEDPNSLSEIPKKVTYQNIADVIMQNADAFTNENYQKLYTFLTAAGAKMLTKDQAFVITRNLDTDSIRILPGWAEGLSGRNEDYFYDTINFGRYYNRGKRIFEFDTQLISNETFTAAVNRAISEGILPIGQWSNIKTILPNINAYVNCTDKSSSNICANKTNWLASCGSQWYYEALPWCPGEPKCSDMSKTNICKYKEQFIEKCGSFSQAASAYYNTINTCPLDINCSDQSIANICKYGDNFLTQCSAQQLASAVYAYNKLSPYCSANCNDLSSANICKNPDYFLERCIIRTEPNRTYTQDQIGIAYRNASC